MPVPSPVDRALRADPAAFALGRLAPHSAHTFTFADGRACQRSLDGPWDFRYTPVAGQPFGRWGRVTVPGHIELQGGPDHPYGIPQYVNKQYPWDGWEAVAPGQLPEKFDPVGEYRKAFTLPAGWQNCFVRFGGADAALELLCNGDFVGYSESSFDTAEFDLTPFVHAGKNTLTARVYRFCSGSWLEDQDFWRMSGLFRPVTLFTKPALHIGDIRTEATFAPGYTAATVRVCCKLEGHLHGEVTLALAGQTQRAPAAAQVVFSVHILAPHLWSAEDPYLYPLTLTTAGERASLDIGLREFVLRDGLLRLNGQRIVFKGVDRHEWSAQNGRAVTYAETERDIVALKRHNVNAVRTSHYPDRNFLYGLCDRYGLYVIDETNLETHGTWERPGGEGDTATILPHDKPQWRAAVLARAAALLERDKNHPCVLMWSCGNESYGGSTLQAVHDYFAQADPSRPVHYEGIFHDRRYNATSDVESQMYTPAAGVRAFLQEHPEKPFLLCEYAHAMGNSTGALDRYTELAYTEPRYQGGFVWEFRDHGLWYTAPDGSRRLAYGGDFGDRPTDWEFCCDGLLPADGQQSDKLRAVAAAYQPFAIEVGDGATRIGNRTLFTDLGAYALRWTLARDGEVLTTMADSRALAPGRSTTVENPLPLPAGPGLYTLTLEVCLRAPTAWAGAGHTVARGQGVFDRSAPAQPAAPALLVRGDFNFGAVGGALAAQVDRATGRLSSLRAGGPRGRELMTAPAELTLWRAPTCNDAGAHFGHRFARWAQAGRYAAAECVEQVGPNAVRARWRLATDAREPVEALYTFAADGCTVTLAWHGPDAEVPAFGLQLPLRPDYTQYTWLGLGPGETMPDRTLGAWLGRFTAPVAAKPPYILPQEHGARCGVRTATLLDGLGALPGLTFASGTGMIFSATAHAPQELENARHIWQLPPHTRTVVRCLAGMRGAGGDDSWGADPLPEYRYTLHSGDTFTFRIGLGAPVLAK